MSETEGPTVVRDETLLRDLDAEHALRGRRNVRAAYVKRRRSDGRTQWVHVTRWDA